MGHNTTIIVMNDALERIREDAAFGEKLATAILKLQVDEVRRPGRGVDIESGGHVNAACVIETHHANVTRLLLVGGNHGRVLHQRLDGGNTYADKHATIQYLREMAKGMGFVLAKNPNTACKRCGSGLNEAALCKDETCPYNDHWQIETILEE